MQGPQNRLDDIIAKLRERHCRITPQRVAILKVFLNSSAPPGVEQVHAQVVVNFERSQFHEYR